MSEFFGYDVFLSYSSRDRDVVRDVAERLRKDGLRVWFDQWVLRPGDSIPAKIEEGLERSRVLVLCMSANAFGSDWARLESGTFRFRDPLNKERRFIPLRLDDATAPGSLGQFLYVDWTVAERGEQFEKLREACQVPSTAQAAVAGATEELDPTPERSRAIGLGHTDPIRSVALSADGRHALSGSLDNTLRLWDVESGRAVRVFEGSARRIVSVALSSDGRHAVSGSEDGTVRMWDVETGRERCVFEGHSGGVNCVALTANGRYVLSGSDDKTLRLWDVETGLERRVFEGHSACVWSVALSADGQRAVSGSDDKTLRLWNVENGQTLRVLEGHNSSVLSVALSADGRRAVSGSHDNTLRLWNVESGWQMKVLGGHLASVGSVALSADGRRALSGSEDGTLRLWNVEDGHGLLVFEGYFASVRSVAMSAAGHLAVSGGDDKTLRAWDLEARRQPREFDGHTSRIFCMAMSADGRRVLSGSQDNTVRLWEVESGRELRVFEGHSDGVLSVALSADGRRALSGGDDRTLRVWDLQSGRELHVLEGHSDRVWSVALSADGRRGLSGGNDLVMRLWDLDIGRGTWVFEGHAAGIRSVALSADGRYALSGSDDRTVRLWDVESGRQIRMFEGHSASVRSVALSADGRRALSGSDDKTLRWWDLESGRTLQVFEGHFGNVRSVALSADGRRALSGSDDKMLWVWDLDRARPLSTLGGHSGRVNSVAMSADGRRVLSSAVNGVIRIWEIGERGGSERDSDTSTDTSHSDGLDTHLEYTNAKVLFVGESGAGKTGLSQRLATSKWIESRASTVGASSTQLKTAEWATQLALGSTTKDGVEREIWLWDFGGQADQRLIHQLYMDDTALAVFVFDGQRRDCFEMLGQWDRDLQKASRRGFTKLLAAGRVDASRVRASAEEVAAFTGSRGFAPKLFETSALTGQGCEELKRAIVEGIPWESIASRTSPTIFKRLKDEIVRMKDEANAPGGRVLMRFNELRDALRLRLAGEGRPFEDKELGAVIDLLKGPGVIWRLEFGGWVLLRPEVINGYAQAVIQTLADDPHQRGCVAEERVLRGELRYSAAVERLGTEDEPFVLQAMYQTLVERGLCLKEATADGPILIFPSFYRRERPEPVGQPKVLMTYRFTGFLDEIYATLVVRLHHTSPFQHDQLWRDAADFRTTMGRQAGLKLTRRADGMGELQVYFDPEVPMDTKMTFTR